MENNITRFIEAQENFYETAFEEMKNGKKETHWMWFIFPQLRVLGVSEKAIYYGINDLQEAKKYIEHPLLGDRLREISKEILKLSGSDPVSLMGRVDAIKLQACMTLFAHATEENQVFVDVLTKYFSSQYDKRTLEAINFH